MACLNQDGKPNEKGLELLRIISGGVNTVKSIYDDTGVTLPRTRQRLRSLVEAGYLIEEDEHYELTEIAEDLDL
jgi:predicted transcriptional regulator